jgi:protein-S-isoprenylcysteine O-methyltransferase Ste14
VSGALKFHICVAFLLAVMFVHFAGAGARTFKYSAARDEGGQQAEIFLQLTVVIVLFLAVYYRIELLNGGVALALAACAVTLYEWCRRTIRGYGLSVIKSETLPESIVQFGPYRFVRHPFYLSYLMANIALVVAFPLIWTLLAAIANFVFFIHGARTEERNLSKSPLGPAYAEYKSRTGMFVPGRPLW